MTQRQSLLTQSQSNVVNLADFRSDDIPPEEQYTANDLIAWAHDSEGREKAWRPTYQQIASMRRNGEPEQIVQAYEHHVSGQRRRVEEFAELIRGMADFPTPDKAG